MRRYTRLDAAQRRAAVVEAALSCIARGGIQDFTVDKVCAEAGISRGLIGHHFGSMSALLAAAYGHMYDQVALTAVSASADQSRLGRVLALLFSPDLFNRDALNIWLTLWGQASVTPELRDEHRRQYAEYRRNMTEAIAEAATANGRHVDAAALALTLICLIDGLGVQHCVEPATMSGDLALQNCRDLLLPYVGPF